MQAVNAGRILAAHFAAPADRDVSHQRRHWQAENQAQEIAD
jgi:hypothetical protein